MTDNELKESQSMIYSILKKDIESPDITLEQKIESSLDMLNQQHELGCFLFTPIAGEKPYLRVLRSVITLIQDNLLLKLSPHQGSGLIEKIKEATFFIITNKMNDPKSSRLKKIIACYNATNPKIDFVNSHFIPHKNIARKIKSTIDGLNKEENKNENTPVLDRNELIKQLQQVIYNTLSDIVKNKNIYVAYKIRKCCDAINPVGELGRILFFPLSLWSQPNLMAGTLESVQWLIENELMKRITLPADAQQLVNDLGKIKNNQSIDKKSISCLNDMLLLVNTKCRHLLQNANEKKESAYYENNNRFKMNNENTNFYEKLSKYIKGSASIQEKIQACSEALQNNNIRTWNLSAVLRIIEVSFIPTIEQADDLINLKTMLQTCQAQLSGAANDVQIQNRFNKIIAMLTIKQDEVSLSQHNTHLHDAENMQSIQIAKKGFAICWKHFYDEADKKLTSLNSTTDEHVMDCNQIIRIKALLQLFNGIFNIDNQEGILSAQSNIINIGEDFYTRICNVVKDINAWRENNKDLAKLIFLEDSIEQKIIDGLAKTNSLFEMRDLLYQEVFGVIVPNEQLQKNIIIIENNQRSPH